MADTDRHGAVDVDGVRYLRLPGGYYLTYSEDEAQTGHAHLAVPLDRETEQTLKEAYNA